LRVDLDAALKRAIKAETELAGLSRSNLLAGDRGFIEMK